MGKCRVLSILCSCILGPMVFSPGIWEVGRGGKVWFRFPYFGEKWGGRRKVHDDSSVGKASICIYLMDGRGFGYDSSAQAEIFV